MTLYSVWFPHIKKENASLGINLSYFRSRKLPMSTPLTRSESVAGSQEPSLLTHKVNVVNVSHRSIVTHFVTPRRVNPLRPAYPSRMTILSETADPSYHNSERARIMKQREFLRFHSGWKPYYYGDTIEKNRHKRQIREGLKSQMQERDVEKKLQRLDKHADAVMIVERDKTDLDLISQQRAQKKIYLQTMFTNENKKMMDERKIQQKTAKLLEQQEERYALLFTPINWSKTLK